MYHSEHALEFNPEAETFEAEQFEFEPNANGLARAAKYSAKES